MKDAELQRIVLERFYDARHKVDRLSFFALTTHLSTIPPKILQTICGQLDELGLIEWTPLSGQDGVVEAVGRITAKGTKVIEGTEPAPAAITIHHDQSIKVAGSTNVQIGDSNTQNVQRTLQRLQEAVDRLDGSPQEKQEAKGLLERISANPLVVAAFGAVLGKALGQ